MIDCGKCVHFLVNPTTAAVADGRCLAPIPAAAMHSDKYVVAETSQLNCLVGKRRSKDWKYDNLITGDES